MHDILRFASNMNSDVAVFKTTRARTIKSRTLTKRIKQTNNYLRTGSVEKVFITKDAHYSKKAFILIFQCLFLSKLAA